MKGGENTLKKFNEKIKYHDLMYKYHSTLAQKSSSKKSWINHTAKAKYHKDIKWFMQEQGLEVIKKKSIYKQAKQQAIKEARPM
jgi:hypothetical protein